MTMPPMQGDVANSADPGLLPNYSASVEYSRAGDRFHYVWAAAQSLKLLDKSSRLQAVWIEGIGGDAVSGDEIIDIAEYYGPGVESFDEVIVRQLKYSTTRTTKNLGLSELGNTLRKFAQVDSRASEILKVPTRTTVRYSIVTNRPIGNTLMNAIRNIIDGCSFKENSMSAKVLAWLQMERDAAASLLPRIEFASSKLELGTLRSQLDVLTGALVGELDPTIPSVLIEQVSRRASGESTEPIRLATVTAAFGATVDDLVPAPALLATGSAAVERKCYRDLAETVLASERPTIITAVGGAGKSTFAAQLPQLLADRATVIVYDCFGNGSYRASNHSRHRHRDGLVQIASELASRALCAPLIPRSATASTEYLKAFRARISEAASRLAESSPGNRLVLVIDAADNAAMAADARPGDTAFVRDLLRMEPIENLCIVLTCRPYRLNGLNPPVGLVPLELPEFSLHESSLMLRTQYPDATAGEVEEFHRRTSANPRIQARALEDTKGLTQCLESLTGIVVEGGDAVEQLLNIQLNEILDAAGSDRGALEFTGQLLSTLRPRIPITVIASLAECDAGLIRSFVSDVGRGLLIDDDAVQFLDEPTETFFRTRYALTTDNAEHVVTRLTALSATSSYAAASLPQVLWEVGRYDQLTQLATSELALPNSSEIERRQVAQLRTTFALRAAIKLRQPAAIVELAMLAGAAAASTERRYTLLRDEPDLAGDLLDSSTLDEVRAARLFPSDWPGAVFGAESVMLTMKADRSGEAQNRLRAAKAAFLAWVHTPRAPGSAQIEPQHSADIALAMMYLHGESTAAQYLEGWRPDRWVVETARRVTATLLSRGEHDRVTRLGAASQRAALSVAIAAELQRLGLPMTPEHVQCAWGTLSEKPIDIDRSEFMLQNVTDGILRGVTWIAAWAVRSGVATEGQAVSLLTRYLPAVPPNDLGALHGRANIGALHAYALRARLWGRSLTLTDLELTDSADVDRREHRDSDGQQAQLEQLLPWLDQWANWVLGNASAAEVQALINAYPTTRSDYRDPILFRRIAGPIAAQLARNSRETAVVQRFQEILATANDHSGLFVAVEMIACLHGDESYADAAYTCADIAADTSEQETQTADQMADELVRIARSIFAYDSHEAQIYFARAVAVMSRVGDDAWQRWGSIVKMGRAADVDDEREEFLLAARLTHTSERLQPYLYDGFDERELIRTVRHITGPRCLAQLSQWRERRFGDLAGMLYSLAEERGGLFDAAPHLAIALSCFSDHIRVGPRLATLQDSGELSDSRFGAVRDLQRARGFELHAEDVDPMLAARFSLLPRVVTALESENSKSRYSVDPELRERKLAELREQLRGIDLKTTEGMTATAEAITEFTSISEIDPLIEAMAERPANQWAAIIHAFRACDGFTAWQQAALLNHACQMRSNSQAFRAALRDLAEDYIVNHGPAIISRYGHGADLDRLATLLQTDIRGVLLLALEATDAVDIVASAESCYRLAGAVAPLLTPQEAVFSLKSALADLERALEIKSWSSEDITVPTTADLDSATAAFLWSALSDPRASIRWRAIHAVRFLLVYGADSFVSALGEIAEGDAVAGYSDERFPFYRMHAVESLLVAVERAAMIDASRIDPLLPVIAKIQSEYPDHVRIQNCCLHIALRCEDNGLARKATIPRQPSEIISRYQRPTAPKPYTHGAVDSEFRFDFDLHEYWLGSLTESFRVEHADVVKEVSDLILDDWEWRESPDLMTDPRKAAGVYFERETYFYKFDFPKGDDLRYYLTYHATLTVAGRLLRNVTPYQDPEDKGTEFDRWFAGFDLAREDRLWLSDARRPVPRGLGHSRRHDDRSKWLWEVSPKDFVHAFLGEDGWVTVQQSARQHDYRTSEYISVTSSLVNRKTGLALVRALQTARSFNNHRVPLAGDDDFTLTFGEFQLRGWLDDSVPESGADSRDDFSSNIRYPTPRPTKWVRELLKLTSSPDGLNWLQEDGTEAVAVSEAWSSKDGSREPYGPDGDRLRVAPMLLADLVAETDSAILLEVRFNRNDESDRSHLRSDEPLGYLDDYVKFFLFTPDDGWRDYCGDPVTR